MSRPGRLLPGNTLLGSIANSSCMRVERVPRAVVGRHGMSDVSFSELTVT